MPTVQVWTKQGLTIDLILSVIHEGVLGTDLISSKDKNLIARVKKIPLVLIFGLDLHSEVLRGCSWHTAVLWAPYGLGIKLGAPADKNVY